MNSEQREKLKLLVYIPLSPAARDLIAEALILTRQLKAETTWLGAGEDTRAKRETIQSLFPRSYSESGLDLMIREGDEEDLIYETAHSTDADIVLLGPIHGKQSEIAMSRRTVSKLSRRLPCSVLLFPQCHREGTRFRQIVCGIKYDAQSVAMLEFVRHLSHLCYSSKIHVVREYDLEGDQGRERGEAPSASTHEWREAEKYLLGEFLQEFQEDHPPMATAVVEGQHGSGVCNYTAEIRAELTTLPAPDEEVSFWDHFFAHPLDKLLADINSCLLLYRDKSIPKEPAEPEEEKE